MCCHYKCSCWSTAAFSLPFASWAWATKRERRNEQPARRLPLTKISHKWDWSEVEIALGNFFPLYTWNHLSCAFSMLPSWICFDLWPCMGLCSQILTEKGTRGIACKNVRWLWGLYFFFLQIHFHLYLEGRNSNVTSKKYAHPTGSRMDISSSLDIC